MIKLNDESRKKLAELGFSSDDVYSVAVGLDDWYNLACDAVQKYRTGYHDISALQGDLLQGDHEGAYKVYGNHLGVWYDAYISLQDGYPHASARARVMQLNDDDDFIDNDPVLVIDTDDGI